jgi:hypothetical protein
MTPWRARVLVFMLFANAACPVATGPSLLHRYQSEVAISPKLYRQLEIWGALPRWHVQALDMRRDWLASLHANVTADDWPSDIRNVGAGLVETGQNMGATQILGSARAILVPLSTPAFIRCLVEIINYPLVRPASSDPDAKMLLDTRRFEGAAKQLASVIGMLSETGYLDSSGAWGPAVVMGTRFVYYHEFGHVIRSLQKVPGRPDWLLDPEADLVEELVADQYAFAMIAVELHRHPDLQPYAFAGIVATLGLVALKEFAESDTGDGRRSIRGAVLRMSRLFYWARLARDDGYVTQEAIDVGQFYWRQITTLLRMIDTVPSPVSSLLQKASESEADWPRARNTLALWCVFGDREKVLAAVRGLRDWALKQKGDPNVTKLLRLIDYLRKEFAPIDDEIGLSAAMER